MIDGKTHREILDLFDAYRKRHPQRISLVRFMMFAGLGQKCTGKDAKAKCQARIDALLKYNLKERGLVRRPIVINNNAAHDVAYEKPKPQPKPQQFTAGLKVYRDPSLATWTPEDSKEQRWKERIRVERQAARETQMAEERASVRGLR